MDGKETIAERIDSRIEAIVDAGDGQKSYESVAQHPLLALSISDVSHV